MGDYCSQALEAADMAGGDVHGNDQQDEHQRHRDA